MLLALMLPMMMLLLPIPCRAPQQSSPNRPTDPALLEIYSLRSTRRRPTQRSLPMLQTLPLLMVALSRTIHPMDIEHE